MNLTWLTTWLTWSLYGHDSPAKSEARGFAEALEPIMPTTPFQPCLLSALVTNVATDDVTTSYSAML